MTRMRLTGQAAATPPGTTGRPGRGDTSFPPGAPPGARPTASGVAATPRAFGVDAADRPLRGSAA